MIFRPSCSFLIRRNDLQLIQQAWWMTVRADVPLRARGLWSEWELWWRDFVSNTFINTHLLHSLKTQWYSFLFLLISCLAKLCSIPVCFTISFFQSADQSRGKPWLNVKGTMSLKHLSILKWMFVNMWRQWRLYCYASVFVSVLISEVLGKYHVIFFLFKTTTTCHRSLTYLDKGCCGKDVLAQYPQSKTWGRSISTQSSSPTTKSRFFFLLFCLLVLFCSVKQSCKCFSLHIYIDIKYKHEGK